MGKITFANANSESWRFYCFLLNTNKAQATPENKMPFDFYIVINNSTWGRLTNLTELKKDQSEGRNPLIRTQSSKTSNPRNKIFSFSLFAEGKPQKGVTYPSALTYSSAKSPAAKAGKCS